MDTGQYILNLGLLGFILLTNLGTRQYTWRRLLLPIAIVVAVAAAYLRDLPTAGNDVTLEVVGIGVGLVFGVVAALLVRVRADERGTVRMTAGIGFAALWIVVIGARMAFAYGADNWFPQQIGQFSRDHLITGADAWTAAFVLMALAMVVGRLAVTAVQATRLQSVQA